MRSTIFHPSNSRSPSAWLLLLPLPVLLASLASASQVLAASASRPFWTEKTSFIEGDELFVVGVASHMRTMEEGRQKAFQHGKLELMNFAQVTDLEARGLTIETQMTYEETNPDGTVTVFRLLRVPVAKLLAIQGSLQAQGHAQEKALDQARQELRSLQESLAQKQQDLETRTRTVQQALAQISQLQTTLSEKAQKIDQQQRQVEQLLQQLTAKYQVKGPQAGGASFDTLKQAEAQLEKREQELDRIYSRAIERIREHSQKACRYVTPGMKPSEVKGLLGEPDGRRYRWDENNVWAYGSSEAAFNSQAVVSHVAGCRGR
jgi:hypothetical protein